MNNTEKLFVHFLARDCGVLDGLLPSGRADDCTAIDEAADAQDPGVHAVVAF